MHEVGLLSDRVSLIEKRMERGELSNKEGQMIAVGDKTEADAVHHRLRQCENEIRMLKARMAKKTNNEGP